MKTKSIKTETGNIHIFDDVFDYSSREKFYYFIQSLSYTPTGSDISTLEARGDFNIFSQVSPEQLDQMKFLTNDGAKHFNHLISDQEIKQIRANLSTLNDSNRFHTDSYGEYKTTTLLYYPNLKWDPEWGGHTMFANKDLSELEYCSFYTPGRVVIFDGHIPHVIFPPTRLAPTYRFSFVIQFGVLNEN